MEWAASSTEVVARAAQPAPEHDRRDPGRRGERAHAHGSHRARQRLGGRGTTTSGGSTAGRASPGSASATAGGTCTSSRATARRRRLVTPGNFDLHNPASAFGRTTSSAWTRRRVGLLHRLARQRDAALPVPHPPRRQGRSRSGSPPRISRAYHLYDISPDGRWAFHTCSTLGTPADRRRRSTCRRTSVVRTLVTNQTLQDRLARLRSGTVEFIAGGHRRRPPARRLGHEAAGLRLDQASIRSSSTSTASRRARRCSTSGRASYLWHLMLTQQGYVVASVDNRGTPSPRGRAWRKAHLQEDRRWSNSADQAAAARVIRTLAVGGLDPHRRVGLERRRLDRRCNLMFRYPELYQTGMSVAPVPDERLLRHDLPGALHGPAAGQRPAAYRDGSPLTSWRTACGATCSWCTARATTTCTSRGPSG